MAWPIVLPKSKISPELRAIYQLIRKYPGISTQSMSQMVQEDKRVPIENKSESGMLRLLLSLRKKAKSDECPQVVIRALDIHDCMMRAGLGDGFRYIVRSVERGKYFGIKEIQSALEINSNSFQKKFNRRLIKIAAKYKEIEQMHKSWLRLRYMNNPIVQMHSDEW